MKTLNKIRNISLAVLALGISSCDKQLDINTDPNNPTSLNSSVLLPRVERFIGDALATGTGFSYNLSAYMHQMTHYGDADQYGAGASDFYWNNGWTYAYRNIITNANIIIQQGEEEGNLKYAGIAKIIKAYMFSVLVDLYGDVPFSEANQLVEGIKYPKYDKGEDIYPALIEMLDAGIADLQNTSAENIQVPGSDDVIYGGAVANWVRAANSIKFKLLVQQRKVKNVSSDVNALISANNLISNTAQSFMIPYGPSGATDDRNPGFGEYYASQRTIYVSPWLYEIMKGYNPNIFTGVSDPRIPYYFYNQLKSTEGPRADVEYRDDRFVSIYFGSTGPNRAKSHQNVLTLFGMYPVGGRYDDGQGGTASAASGTGAAPYRLITYADILFLKAELIQEGVITGNAATTLEEAIKESFKMVDYVVSRTGHSQGTIPTLSGSAGETDYVTKVMAQFNAGSAAKKLEIIMTQKWLSSVGSNVDQYTDYRRTGYPVLFDPAAFGGSVTPPSGGNGGEDLPTVPVVANRKFPLSLPFLIEEINLNPNAPAQKSDLSTAKVFWMP
jgi:hypothetical protein